jgi:hypothetical protein
MSKAFECIRVANWRVGSLVVSVLIAMPSDEPGDPFLARDGKSSMAEFEGSFHCVDL